jgi:hypothetical protein
MFALCLMRRLFGQPANCNRVCKKGPRPVQLHAGHTTTEIAQIGCLSAARSTVGGENRVRVYRKDTLRQE